MMRMCINRSRCCMIINCQSELSKLPMFQSATNLSDKRGSTTERLKGQQPPKARRPPDKIKSDWISPPDPVSNLRLIKFYIPEDETPAEREFRLLRQDTQDWNQDFWSRHNKNFAMQKEKFIKEELVKLKGSLQASAAGDSSNSSHGIREDSRASTEEGKAGSTAAKATAASEELDTSSLSAETMAKFYKKFLDDNYQLHRNYNKQWYRRNFGLLWPAFKVQLERLFRQKRSVKS